MCELKLWRDALESQVALLRIGIATRFSGLVRLGDKIVSHLFFMLLCSANAHSLSKSTGRASVKAFG